MAAAAAAAARPTGGRLAPHPHHGHITVTHRTAGRSGYFRVVGDPCAPSLDPTSRHGDRAARGVSTLGVCVWIMTTDDGSMSHSPFPSMSHSRRTSRHGRRAARVVDDAARDALRKEAVSAAAFQDRRHAAERRRRRARAPREPVPPVAGSSSGALPEKSGEGWGRGVDSTPHTSRAPVRARAAVAARAATSSRRGVPRRSAQTRDIGAVGVTAGGARARTDASRNNRRARRGAREALNTERALDVDEEDDEHDEQSEQSDGERAVLDPLAQLDRFGGYSLVAKEGILTCHAISRILPRTGSRFACSA